MTQQKTLFYQRKKIIETGYFLIKEGDIKSSSIAGFNKKVVDERIKHRLPNKK